jgi:amino acid transporter
MAQPQQAELVRGIGRWDLVALAVNAIIGAGIFGLPSKVQSLIGPYSLIAFIVCAVVVTLIILCFAEVGSRFSVTGGPYVYAREAFGPVVGFEVGWLVWLARLMAFAANCNLFVQYLGYIFPVANSGWWRPAIITAIVGLLTVVNILGVRDAALFSDFFTIGKMVPLLLFIAVGLFFLNSANYAWPALPSSHAFSNSVLLLVYAFSGFEIAFIPSGEVRDPQRNLPFALLVAIGIVSSTYILVQVVCIGTLPTLGESTRPLVDASSTFLGGVGAWIITAGVLISIAGNLNVILLSGSRLPFAMAQERELPRWLAATHRRFHTPHLAILLTSAIILIVTVSGSFIYAVTISTIARLLTYMVTCAALPVLRRREREQPALFHVPAARLVVALSLVLSAWLLANSTWREARDGAIAASFGMLVYAVQRWRRAEV